MGAITGAIVGGALKAADAYYRQKLRGSAWQDAFWDGVLMGAIGGAIAGLMAGIAKGAEMARKLAEGNNPGGFKEIARVADSGQTASDAGKAPKDDPWIHLKQKFSTSCIIGVAKYSGMAAIGGYIMTLQPPPGPQIVGGIVALYGAYMASDTALSCGSK